MQHFYHVLIRMPEDEGLRCILRDLSVDALRAKFLKPYRKGAKIICDSSVVDAARLVQVKIAQTSKNAETEILALRTRSEEQLDRLNRDSSSVVFVTLGHGYSNDELGDLGTDVKADFLRG